MRPKLPPGENWRVVLKARECVRGKEWVVVKRTTTKGRREWVSPAVLLTTSKLMQDDGKFSGVSAYKLVTPRQRGYARTVQKFRNYPLTDDGSIRIGVCLPGEPFDQGPSTGDVLAVVGVRYDDVLTVYSAPGSAGDPVTTLDPLADDVIALGQGRLLDGTIWYRVSANGTAGWVNSSFVQYLGDVDDVTSTIIAEIGSTPFESSMADLGLVVAEHVASTDPPSRITMTVAPSVADLGEVTYDVVGLGSDSVGGYRLHVFGTPDESGFGLKSVERTLMCLRGVSEGGLCV